MGICAVPVHALDEVPSDPQAVRRRLIAEIDHPEEDRLRHVVVPFQFVEVEFGIGTLGFPPGEDAEPWLLEKGSTLEDIERLRELKAIAGSMPDGCL